MHHQILTIDFSHRGNNIDFCQVLNKSLCVVTPFTTYYTMFTVSAIHSYFIQSKTNMHVLHS